MASVTTAYRAADGSEVPDDAARGTGGATVTTHVTRMISTSARIARVVRRPSRLQIGYVNARYDARIRKSNAATIRQRVVVSTAVEIVVVAVVVVSLVVVVCSRTSSRMRRRG